MSLFSSLLATHRQRAMLSQNALARHIGCDPAYICRAEKATQAMSRPFVEIAARVLQLNAYDSAQLLAAAGFWPWPDVPFRDVLAMLAAGASLDMHRDTEAA